MKSSVSPSKIAIVLPVYNVENFLYQCLDSILSQTYKHFVVFAINDGSTDRSAKILSQYKQKDNRIVVIDQKNKGLAAARNSALSEIEKDSSFSFICFIDSDDFVAPNFLKSHLEMINKKCADVSICGFLKFSHAGNFRQQHQLLHEQLLNNEDFINLIFSQKNWAKACGAGGMVWKHIYRCETVRGLRFPEDRLILEDEPYSILVAKRAKNFVYFPETLYYYRQSNNSLCKNKNFSVRRMHGRKLCLDQSSTFSKSSQLAILAAYVEAVISLMKQGEPSPNLRIYAKNIKCAYRAKTLKTKTLILFFIFCYIPIISKIYINLRKTHRKVRSLLGLRI